MQIEGKNISFRYGENRPWILKDVSICIKEGERTSGRTKRIWKEHFGKNFIRIFETSVRRSASGWKAIAAKRRISGAVDLSASGESN